MSPHNRVYKSFRPVIVYAALINLDVELEYVGTDFKSTYNIN